jgi:hypothetical protein
MCMRFCYLDCHEAGLCCYLVIQIENVLPPLKLFYITYRHSLVILSLRNVFLYKWDVYIGSSVFDWHEIFVRKYCAATYWWGRVPDAIEYGYLSRIPLPRWLSYFNPSASPRALGTQRRRFSCLTRAPYLNVSLCWRVWSLETNTSQFIQDPIGSPMWLLKLQFSDFSAEAGCAYRTP